GFDVVGSHTYLTATSPGTVDEPPLNFDVKVVDHHAGSTDPNGAAVAVSGDVVLSGHRLSLSGGGVTGTVTSVLDGGPAVTLTNLPSVTFDGAPRQRQPDGELQLRQPAAADPDRLPRRRRQQQPGDQRLARRRAGDAHPGAIGRGGPGHGFARWPDADHRPP